MKKKKKEEPRDCRFDGEREVTRVAWNELSINLQDSVVRVDSVEARAWNFLTSVTVFPLRTFLLQLQSTSLRLQNDRDMNRSEC